MIPFDKQSPFVTSGIRVGSAALTTRGFDADAMRKVAELIDAVLSKIDNASVKQDVKKEVRNLCDQYPLYANLESS